MSSSGSVLRYDEAEFTDRAESEAFGPQEQKVFDHGTSRVIGQDRAWRGIANSLSLYYAGLNDQTKPIGTFLFSGPTGWGKTYTAEELARFLIADVPRAPLIRIPCGKYSERHRVSELIGSPPGYVDSDKMPLLSQFNLDEAHFWIKVTPLLEKTRAAVSNEDRASDMMADLYEANKPYFSVILFDEVEKAHSDLHNALLHIIDDGELPLSHGMVTSFANSIIILTCNVGGREQQEMLAGKGRAGGIGFGRGAGLQGELSDAQADALDQDIYKRTIDQIEKMFAPELVGRLKEDIVVFRTLSRSQQRTVLDTMLASVQDRLAGRSDSRAIPLSLLFTDGFKEFLLDQGINRKYGLRPLKRTVRKFVLLPLAKAISGGGLRAADEVLFRSEKGRTTLFRKKRPSASANGLNIQMKR